MVWKKFRKKPVVISAAEWNEKTRDELKKMGADLRFDGATPSIMTLEGAHIISEGDWIVKGIKGEFYPVKPDIFEQTCEEVE